MPESGFGPVPSLLGPDLFLFADGAEPWPGDLKAGRLARNALGLPAASDAPVFRAGEDEEECKVSNADLSACADAHWNVKLLLSTPSCTHAQSLQITSYNKGQCYILIASLADAGPCTLMKPETM